MESDTGAYLILAIQTVNGNRGQDSMFWAVGSRGRDHGWDLRVEADIYVPCGTRFGSGASKIDNPTQALTHSLISCGIFTFLLLFVPMLLFILLFPIHILSTLLE